MPTIKTPLPKFSDFPKLRKVVSDIRERIELYVDEKRISTQLKGTTTKRDGKTIKTPGMNYKLFSTLRHLIPNADVKSFEFEIDDSEDGQYDGRYQVSLIAYDKGRTTLDKPTLLSTPWTVEQECKCGKTVKVKVMLPPKVLQAAMKEGEVPEPTVSVTRIKVEGEESDDDDE